jgi:hypothetical protein
MTKENIQHQDKLGRDINVGDVVAVADHNNLMIATVTKLNPKMVKVARIPSRSNWEQNKYPSDMVVVPGADVTMYLLKSS